MPIASIAAPPVEGEAVTGFTLETVLSGDALPEEAEPEDIEIDAEAEIVTGDALPPDPLQMLIEDLSGITGSLRRTVTPQPGDAAPAEAGPAAMATATIPTAAPAVAEMPLPELARADAGIAVAIQPDSVTAEIESLLADPATPIQPSAKEIMPAIPAEPRAARPAAPVPVARQIAEAIVTTRDDLVEIALAPEELGRIRMIVSGAEHSPHVMIWVERPEVLDQLRRNSAFLQECLGDAGMADASFEFADDARSGADDRRTAPVTGDWPGAEIAEPVMAIPMAWTPMAIPARLDIRI